MQILRMIARGAPATLAILGMLLALLRGAHLISWPWFYIFAPWAFLFAGVWVVLAIALFGAAAQTRRERNIRHVHTHHKHKLS